MSDARNDADSLARRNRASRAEKAGNPSHPRGRWLIEPEGAAAPAAAAGTGAGPIVIDVDDGPAARNAAMSAGFTAVVRTRVRPGELARLLREVAGGGRTR